MSRNFLIIIVIVIIVLVGGYFFFFSSNEVQEDQTVTQTESSGESLRVRLGWVHQAQFAGLYAAKEKGFFRNAGLDVELLALDQNINQVEELNRGDVDFSIMEAHQLLAGIDTGADLKAVAVIYKINPHVLAARADSGIVGPEDFAGKVLGLAGGEGEGNVLFRIFVEQFSNDPESVTYKQLGFNTVDSFIKGEADIIDLYSIDQPYLAEQRGMPLNIIPLDAYGFSTYGDVITVSNSLLTERPEVVRKFVKASLDGWGYALSNIDETVDITLGFATGDYKDPLYQEHILVESIPLVRGDSIGLGRMELVPWSTLFESMKRAGALTGNFNVTDVFTNSFIE